MSQDVATIFSKIGIPKPKKLRSNSSRNVNDGKDTPLSRAQKAIQKVKSAPVGVSARKGK